MGLRTKISAGLQNTHTTYNLF